MLSARCIRPVKLTKLFPNKQELLYNLNNPVFNELSVTSALCRYVSKKAYKIGMDRKPTPKIEFTAQSIASKGFLRPCKDYQPPNNYTEVIIGICTKVLGDTQSETTLHGDKKCQILLEISEALDHSVPNSLLHQIQNIGDVLQFYGTTVDARMPLDRMRHVDLPENLHVQFEYKRWHPDTDEKFGGVTAFPESSTLVTGLRYRNKYKGHRQDVKVLRK